MSAWQLSTVGFPHGRTSFGGVVWDIFATDIAPALVRAQDEGDLRDGVCIAFEAAMTSASRSEVPLPTGMTLEIVQSSFVEPVGRMIRRAQKHGLLRADFDPDKDTFRVLLMILGVLPTLSPGSDGWKRYLLLVTDSLTLMPTDPLPLAEALADPFRQDW